MSISDVGVFDPEPGRLLPPLAPCAQALGRKPPGPSDIFSESVFYRKIINYINNSLNPRFGNKFLIAHKTKCKITLLRAIQTFKKSMLNFQPLIVLAIVLIKLNETDILRLQHGIT